MKDIRTTINWIGRGTLTMLLIIIVSVIYPLFKNVGLFGQFCHAGLTFMLSVVFGWCLCEFLISVVRMNKK